MKEEYDRRESVEGILFALPYLLAFGVFLLYPLLKGLYMSFYDWNALFPSESEFIGLENYRTLLSDPLFWDSLVNTVYFVVLTVPPLVIFSTLLALGVNRNVKGKWLMRTVFFSPYILTVSVIGLLFQELFAGGGFIAYWLNMLFGLETNFLRSTTWAMFAVAAATVWWQIAFNFIIMLAARQGVPDRLYEAARLDGASSYEMLRDITIPQMRNPILFVVIITFIGSFQVFGQPWIMTQGGPDFSTTTIVMYLYQSGFQSRSFGYAAAIGYILFLILISVSLVNYYALSGDE
jgi:multiple sugar transport system permease protein